MYAQCFRSIKSTKCSESAQSTTKNKNKTAIVNTALLRGNNNVRCKHRTLGTSIGINHTSLGLTESGQQWWQKQAHRCVCVQHKQPNKYSMFDIYKVIMYNVSQLFRKYKEGLK